MANDKFTGPLRFGHGPARVQPIETFERNAILYRDCATCHKNGNDNWFVTYGGLQRHYTEVHDYGK